MGRTAPGSAMTPSLSSTYLVAQLAKQLHSMKIKYELCEVLQRFEYDLISKQEVHAPTEQLPTPSPPRGPSAALTSLPAGSSPLNCFELPGFLLASAH